MRIKKFYGTSENAVKTQIWIAIIKRRLRLDPSLYGLLQVLSLTLFEKATLQALLQGDTPRENRRPLKQLNLFWF